MASSTSAQSISIFSVVLVAANNVSVYGFLTDTDRPHPDLEFSGGSAFVVKRITEPFHQLIVLNPANTGNLVVNISRDLEYEVDEQYIFFSNPAKEFYGIHFEDTRQPQEFVNLFKSIIDSYQESLISGVTHNLSYFKDPEPTDSYIMAANLDHIGLHLQNNLASGMLTQSLFQVSDAVALSPSKPQIIFTRISASRLIDMVHSFLRGECRALLVDFDEPESVDIVRDLEFSGGSAFVVKRFTEPFHQLIVLNPANTGNHVVNISRDLEYEVDEQYIFFSNPAKEFYGIHFEDTRQPQEFVNLFKSIIDSYQESLISGVTHNLSYFKDPEPTDSYIMAANLDHIGLHLQNNLAYGTLTQSLFQVSDAVALSPSRPQIIFTCISASRLIDMIHSFLRGECRALLVDFDEPEPVDRDLVCYVEQPVSWADLPLELWTHIAERVGGCGVLRLAATSSLFRDFVRNDIIWKGAFLVDTGLFGRLIDDIQVNTPWREIYSRSFLEARVHPGWPTEMFIYTKHGGFVADMEVLSCFQLGAFMIDSGSALLTFKLTEELKYGEFAGVTTVLHDTPFVVVENVKKGIWIVDLLEVGYERQPVHLTLEARHCEEPRQTNRDEWILLDELKCKEAVTSFSIFDTKHIGDDENGAIFLMNLEAPGLHFCATLHAVASNMQHLYQPLGWIRREAQFSVDGKIIRLKMRRLRRAGSITKLVDVSEA